MTQKKNLNQLQILQQQQQQPPKTKMRFFILVALIAVCSAQAPWTKDETQQFFSSKNCDFFGFDLISNAEATRANVTDVAACACNCQARPECTHFTYNRALRACFLKTPDATRGYRANAEADCGFVQVYKNGCCVGEGYIPLVYKL